MHKYHKEMMAMAEAAKTSETPWDVLEVTKTYTTDFGWVDCDTFPNFDDPFNSFRIKPKEKKKLWLWHLVENNRVIDQAYCPEEATDRFYIGWHKTNTFIEIEGE